MSNCDPGVTKVVRVPVGASSGGPYTVVCNAAVNGWTVTDTSSGSNFDIPFSCVSFDPANLTTAQNQQLCAIIEAAVTKLDLSMLTDAQITDLCARLLAVGCDLLANNDFSNLSVQQATDICAQLLANGCDLITNADFTTLDDDQRADLCAIISDCPSASVAVIKTSNPNPAVVGDVVGYTLSIVNSGDIDATNVVVSDVLNGSMTYTAGSIAGTGADNFRACKCGNIPNHAA